MQRSPRSLCHLAGRLLSWTLSACALLALALPAPAQTSARFDPAQHLDDWNASYLSDYSDLYDFRPFEDAAGESLSAEQLERLRAAWRAERVRVLQEIERIETDSGAAAIYRAQRKLYRNRHLSQLEFEVLEGEPPFLYFVQSPPKETSGYAQRVAASVGPWLGALLERFERELARPLELARAPASEVLPVVVLSSKGNFDDFMRVVYNVSGPGYHAVYEPHLNMLVLYRGGVHAADSAEQAKRRADLRGAVKFLWQAHGARAETLLGPPWLRTGIAYALAEHDGNTPEVLRGAPYAPELVRVLVELLRADEKRTLYWNSLGELRGVVDASQCEALASARAQAGGLTEAKLDATLARTLFDAQAGGLAHYLLYGAGGAWRERFLALIGATLRGKDTPELHADFFAALEAAHVEVELVRHLFSQHITTFPSHELSDAELARVITALHSTPTAAGAAADVAAAPLAAAFLGHEARFALALARVRSGDAEAALEILRELHALAAGDARERAAVELERVEAWIELRDRYLAHLAQHGARLSIDYRGSKLTAKVEGFADGMLLLGKNRQELERVPASALEPLELVGAMDSDKAGFVPSWVRAYPNVLAGGKGWRRALTGDDAASALLREHAELDYPARMEAVDAAAALVALADGPMPANSVDAQFRIDEIAALWRRSADVPFVTLARPGLIALARDALLLQFTEQGLAAVLNTRSEALADGRLRLLYDFTEERQALDWPQIDAEPEGRAAHLLRPMRSQTSSFDWHTGALEARGHVARRHVLEFEGPTRMRCTWTSRGVEEHAAEGAYYFLLALCARAGSWAGILNGLCIDLRDKANGDWRQAPEDAQVDTFFDTAYDMELVHDGERSVRMIRDEKLVAETSCGELRSGGVLLWILTDHPVSFTELELEGRPTAASLAALGESWIAERLAHLGLAGDASGSGR